MKQEYEYPVWAWGIFILMYVFLFFTISPFIVIIQIALFFWCKVYFVDWAIKIKGNPIAPFMLTLFFGLVGYLGYYIYYRNKIKEKGK
jgi:hypothetical protein